MEIQPSPHNRNSVYPRLALASLQTAPNSLPRQQRIWRWTALRPWNPQWAIRRCYVSWGDTHEWCGTLWDNSSRMTPRVRQFVVTATLALVVAICTPVFVHRHDLDVALSRWMRDQSSENAAVLKAEARNSRWAALTTQMEAGVVAFLLLNAGWLVVGRIISSGTPRGHPKPRSWV